MPANKSDTIRKSWRAATRVVREGTHRSEWFETSEALYLNSGFVYDSAFDAEAAFSSKTPPKDQRFVYSRFGNPTNQMLEKRLAALEGAEACKVTASGMAAVFAALACQLKAGDRIVSARALFGSCHYIVTELLPRWGIESVLVDGVDLDQWKTALAKPAKAVFLETPSNPMLDLVDIKAVSKLAHKAGACVVVDNVFATPMYQKPLALGADVVIYSATKHIDGQGRVLGGAVLGRQKWIDETLVPFLRHTGPTLSAFNAWVLLKGIETLPLRVEAQTRNALIVAKRLEKAREIERVYYPGLKSHPQYALARKQMKSGSTLVAFDVKGGKKAAFAFQDALQTIDISNNLGDVKSLISHPATTTHQRLPAEEKARLGIGPGSLRLSVGIEDPADLLEDIERALAAARKAR
ncbi:MAG: O-succinylhomoserine sulfhydrylase [Alphaproteobacteria bacterium]|nr:O-succinylhomoserine sulfhydrylase [Alphaproteobacteria bacterium]